MSTFARIIQGTRARKSVPFALAGHDPVDVDVRPLTAAEELQALKQARSMATARGVDDPKEGEPMYDLCLMASVLLVGCIDHDSTATDPRPFFDNVEQVLSLGRDHIVFLYEHHDAWQEQTSPRKKNLTTEEYMAVVMALASREEGDLDPFVSWPRATLASCMRTMAQQLVNSLAAKSPATSSPVDSTANSSRPSHEGG